jgi:hypothetical protein
MAVGSEEMLENEVEERGAARNRTVLPPSCPDPQTYLLPLGSATKDPSPTETCRSHVDTVFSIQEVQVVLCSTSSSALGPCQDSDASLDDQPGNPFFFRLMPYLKPVRAANRVLLRRLAHRRVSSLVNSHPKGDSGPQPSPSTSSPPRPGRYPPSPLLQSRSSQPSPTDESATSSNTVDVSRISFSGWEGEVLEQGRQAGLSEVQVREVWHDFHGTSLTSRSSRLADEVGGIDTLSALLRSSDDGWSYRTLRRHWCQAAQMSVPAINSPLVLSL